MLGDSGSSVLGSSGDAVAEHMAAAAVPAHDSPDVGGVGSNSGEEDKGTYKGDEGDRSYGGNRWPRQETLALLKIRSDMDLAFKDASVKGPLWEDVSRKLAELGYHRSAKKCKEKFENVYKYHKRTKEGRTGKSDGKTYRFFNQLEALETHPSHIQSSTPVKPHQNIVPTTVASTATSTAMRPLSITPSLPAQITVTSVSHSTMNMSQAGIKVSPAVNLTIPSFPLTNPTILPPPPPPTTTNPSHNASIRSSFPNISTDLLSNSTSSSTFSDEELQLRRKRKRKWKDFFERLMKEVIQKQEELQKKFLDAIEKREHERMIREESWRMQEISRINKEREILAQERSLAAAKDAAVMTFLQKISEQQNPGQAFQYNPPEPQPAVQPAPPPAPQPALVAVTQPAPVSAPATVLPPHTVTGFEIQKFDNGENCTPTSSSRWPKVEVQALINLRTNLDAKYQDNGPKGPLWEEISAAMRKIGYNRSAKRCKEKWENINKYFKKVKESNKKRPEDSKTCPYFHQLDALYREKNKFENPSSTTQVLKLGNSTNMVPLMVRPEQQWPPQQEQLSDDAAMDDVESEPMDQNQEEGDKEGDEEEEEEEEEEDGAGNFEIVASKPANSIGAVE